MQFWIKCTRFGTGEAYHVNISLVGGMRRDGEKTILEFVGSNAQTIDVSETSGGHSCNSPRGAAGELRS